MMSRTVEVEVIVVVDHQGDWICAGESGIDPLEVYKEWSLYDEDVMYSMSKRPYRVKVRLPIPDQVTPAERSASFAIDAARFPGGFATPIESVKAELRESEGAIDVLRKAIAEMDGEE